MRVARLVLCALLVGGGAAAAHAQATTVGDTAATHPAGKLAPLRRPVTLALRDVPVVTAIQAIDRQADLRLSYTDRLPHLDRRVSIAVTNMPAGDALAKVLEGTGIVIRVREKGRITLVRDTRGAVIQVHPDTLPGQLWGRVSDSATSKPIKDAIVSVMGTLMSTTTNDSGYYSFTSVPAGVQTIVARVIGFRPLSAESDIVGGQLTRVDFALQMQMSRLQEVVTTATGPRRRLELGNDITILNVDSIVATQPVQSVTDILATRVPGLTVIRTSGAPGDPSRLRFRGVHSALLSNDPIVIVDGVRVYAEQSSPRSGNLTNTNPLGYAPPAPSPIDQLDPNSIATIEVLKGPSASTLYGSDAANGVIVITTKHGRAGPAHWSAHVDYGRSYQPGRYPEGVFRWGHMLATHETVWCALRDQTCALDSISRFQLLNVPQFSVLGTGNRKGTTLGVSGGSPSLTYNLQGSWSDEIGLLTLPSYEVDRFETREGTAPPDWMEHPHDYRDWSAATGLNMRLSNTANVSVQASFSRSNQQRSTLETQLASLMRIFVDSVSGNYYEANGGHFTLPTSVFGDFYRRVTSQASTLTNGLSLNWQPRSWLTVNADAGLNSIDRDDRMVLPRNLAPEGPDTVGAVSLGRGASLMRTVNVRASALSSLPLGFNLQTAVGANYTSTGTSDILVSGTNLAAGTTSLNGAGQIQPPVQTQTDLTTFGWYVEPTISAKRLWISTGLRLDGGSTFGSHVSLPLFPKVSVSYLISDEPFFPFKKVFNTLRLRAAYGQAGVQPGVGDRLRLFHQQQIFIDSALVTSTTLNTLGNTKLKPERSKEFEGGFDTDLFGDRVSLGFTGYRQTRFDALIAVPLPPSVYGDLVTSVLKNVGVIRNTGIESTLQVEALRSDFITWGVNLLVSRNSNKVLSLAPGVSPFFNATGDGRIVAGYPLFGRWARPVVGYQDVNHDGLIESNEVQVGDSLVYLGSSEPDFEATIGTHLSFFRGRVSIDADFHYTGGLTQLNQTALDNQIFSVALNDPNAPFGQQAAVAAMDRTIYGEMQTVNTFRFNSLAVAYALPPSAARLFRAETMSIAVQGTNLGLFTNYRGKDPNVNAYGSGNGIADTGVLPLPREWQVRVSATY